MTDRKWKSTLGDVVITYRDEGRRYEVTTSRDGEAVKSHADESADVGDKQVPKWIELTTSGGAGPDMRVRVEVRDGSPQIVELSWIARAGQREIRQKDLRNVDLPQLAGDLYSGFFQEVGPFPTGPDGSFPDDQQIDEWAAQVRKSRTAARNFVDRQRRPREHRAINDDFLKSVAAVYRANIHKRAPVEEVVKHFGVGYRTSSLYVEKARKRGFLPPTTRGKKQA
jgi:hypothetical protein